MVSFVGPFYRCEELVYVFVKSVDVRCAFPSPLGVIADHPPSPIAHFESQVGLVVAWYAGNTLYNVYNKKATNMIHAHWFVACAQLFVGMLWSTVMWVSGMRKKPNLTAADIAACVPIGLMASLSHAGSVLAVSNDVI
jgi:hypothetical protein